MKRKFLLPLLIGIGFIAGACSENASVADIDEPKVKGKIVPSDYEAKPPDKLTVFQNVDTHPNIVRLCIDGIAFRTISNGHNGGLSGAVARVEEWDEYCNK